MDYDVVIVGAGPAGACAGALLAQAGARIALIDRSVFPRDKLCGGLLSQKTITLLNQIAPNTCFPHFDINRAHVLYKRKDFGAVELLSSVQAVYRYQFDALLVELARSLGAHTYLGTQVLQIDYERHLVDIKGGHELRYEHLIGADGALSKVRRLAGLPAAHLGFCAEVYIPWEQIVDSSRLRANGILLLCGEFQKGYGWVFPNQESVAIGMGSLTSEMTEREIIDVFPHFVKRFAHVETVKPRGAYIPSGSTVSLGRPDYQAMALIGDAAGLIDPLTGEGIYYAIISAQKAAEALLFDSRNFFSAYCCRMESIVERIREGVWVRNQFYTPLIMRDILGAAQSIPQYIGTLIDETIVQYTKSYMTAYEELREYIR